MTHSEKGFNWIVSGIGERTVLYIKHRQGNSMIGLEQNGEDTAFGLRETRIRESVLGQPLIPRSEKGERSGCRTEIFPLSDNCIIPNFRRKQGDMVIWMREQKWERDDRTVR